MSALEKTARQAERAGQIIQRIRAFVRKSVPQRQPAQAQQIVDDALELASIELRRRNVAIHSYVAQRLPELNIPVQILWGAEDEWQPSSYAHRLHGDIPGSTLQLIDNAGHFLMEDQPLMFAEKASAFIHKHNLL